MVYGFFIFHIQKVKHSLKTRLRSTVYDITEVKQEGWLSPTELASVSAIIA